MTTTWLYRYHLIVSAADRDAANQVAVEVTGDEADRLTFGVPLSVSGNEPATHFGCSTAATDPIRTGLAVRLGAGRVPSIKFWRLDAQTGLLVQTNVAASVGKVGQTLTWEQALVDAGLMTVQAEMV